ncbi:DUF3021 domain-containing protein [Enterococcus saccharolyticus]|uniref:DUF3021 domain-containing protein n=1 Tax=Enterococcus saccharolyticus TaxID=41997 RepID=UPI001E634A86|nr:DUF3021 domain-containing protein [Enterococcus saccharolyticus]MCD5001403.1 DUF3021 domain-containing protein [Enterococcus saccharolyticus]
MKKIIKNGLLGVGVSSIIFTMSGIFFADHEVRRNILLIVGLGIIMGVLSTIHESTKLSLLSKTIFQLSGGYVSFLVAAYFGHWFPFKIGVIVTASVLFFTIFFVIWTVFYFKEKKELEELNKKFE